MDFKEISSLPPVASSYILGALPPWAQMAREKTAIQNDPKLKELLDGKEILDISEFCVQDNGNKEYLVRLKDSEHFVRATIVYTHDNLFPGPANFKVEIGNLELPGHYATGRFVSGVY